MDDGFYAEFMRRDEDRKGPGMPDVTLASGAVITIFFLRDKLADMRDRQEHFRDVCLSGHGKRQLRPVKGRLVVMNPDWFRECEWSARYLREGVGALDLAFPKWNKAAGTNFAPPRGDPADQVAWTKFKESFANFSNDCNIGAQKMGILEARSPGETEKSIYSQYAERCTEQWRALFNPGADSNEDTKPNDAVQQANESSRKGVTDPKGGVKAKDLDEDEEMAAIGRGEYKRGSQDEYSHALRREVEGRRVSGGAATKELQDRVTSQGKAGEIGGVEILGGRTGEMMEALVAFQTQIKGEAGGGSTLPVPSGPDATPISPASCDTSAYAAQGNALVARNAPLAQNLSIQAQACFSARLTLFALKSDLAFLRKCGPAGQIASTNSQLQATLADEQRVCGPGAGPVPPVQAP